jgi:hypothetical protein
MAKTGKLSNETLYNSNSNPNDLDGGSLTEGLMPFRPNYRQDRLERDRAARARTDEKQRKRDEKSAKRKLNAPKPKVHRAMSIASLIVALGISYDGAALESRARFVVYFVSITKSYGLQSIMAGGWTMQLRQIDAMRTWFKV